MTSFTNKTENCTRSTAVLKCVALVLKCDSKSSVENLRGDKLREKFLRLQFLSKLKVEIFRFSFQNSVI